MQLDLLLRAARGDRPVERLLSNARIVNVFTGEVTLGAVAIEDEWIVGLGTYEAREVVDLEGAFLSPGWIDAHLHLESAMVSPGQFARAVLPLGTTAVVADPHEITNVLGTAGIDYMLAATEAQPLGFYFTLPSCVPASPLETSGARLEAAQLEPYLDHARVVALAEVMNFPGLIGGDAALLAKLQATRRRHKRIDGHAPGLSGRALQAYLAAGVASDHECTTAAEAHEKLAGGMHVMVREGTGARNLEALLPAITPHSARRMMWCSDDRHPGELLQEGHIDSMLRRAIAAGLDPVRAIQMASLNPAEYFGLHHLGAIAPGRRADLVLFEDLAAPVAKAVYSGGRLVARWGELLPEVALPAAAAPPTQMQLPPRIDLAVPAGRGQLRVIGIQPGQLLTHHLLRQAHLQNGLAEADPQRDLLKLAVVARHGVGGGVGVGFVEGLGLQRGALASSVAHDSHNLIVAGASDAEMQLAAQAVARMNGGLAVVAGDRVLASLALPIAGLMSPRPLTEVHAELQCLNAAAHALGARLPDPFMTLSFLALPVIPALKLTDRGLVDVERFEFVPLFNQA